MSIKNNSKSTYVYVARHKDCDLLHDKSVLSSGRTPHDKKQTVFDYNQNLVKSPGEAQRQDWGTGRPSVAKWLWLWKTNS
jgi:hypothetical protein